MIRRYVSGPETHTILDQCHHGSTGGHYEPTTTAKKVLDSGFYWTTIIKEAHTLVRLCDACQKTRNISKRDKMPLNSIQGDYDMWRLRIEQYFQVQDYALWDVIENRNSFKPAAQTTTKVEGTSTTLIRGHVTADEKYKDAKTLFAVIQTRFGGNEATKKTQKTLLKQMYENFSALSTKSIDSIFNRLQKIASQLAILGMSFDDLYNNFKIVEQEVKGTTNSSSSSSSQNMAFVSSPSSTNEVNTASTQVSPASTQVSIASTQSVSTVTRWDTLQGNAEELGTKITETGIKTALGGL
ncbi:ribonuclease H-like domain-containing protein [Tanacetum coccineum]